MLHAEEYFYILISFSISLLIHYLVIELTHRKGIFLDEHDKIQKMHEKPTPRVGGLGVFLSSMFILNDHALGGYLILCAIPAFVAGFLEDYSGRISPLQRLAIMCLSPIMAFIMIPTSILTNWGFMDVPAILGMVASMFLIIASVNGVNFTDGQNGLAGGSMLVSCILLAFISYLVNDHSAFYISIIIGASALSFLVYNFPNGKIFLGDGGAYLLGFLIAILGITIIQNHANHISFLVLPAILIYPLWEVAFSIIRKVIYDHISPLNSDDFHIHQLLFRNYANGKGFLPTLLILPLQAITSIFVALFLNNSTALIIIIGGFALIYSIAYFWLRKADMLKLNQVSALK